MFIDIVEIWFRIANGQILSVFDKSYLPTMSVFSFPDDNCSKYQSIFTKRSGIVHGQISSIFEESTQYPQHDSDGVLSFHVFIGDSDYFTPIRINPFIPEFLEYR